MLIALGCMFTSLTLLKYQSSLATLHLKKQKEGEAVLATLRSGPQLKQELTLVKQINARIEENLVSDIDLEENLQYFFRMQEVTKAHVITQPLNVPPDNNPNFKRVPFALKVSGSYQELAAFIQALETGPKLCNITYFALSRKGNALVLDMNLELLGRK